MAKKKMGQSARKTSGRKRQVKQQRHRWLLDQTGYLRGTLLETFFKHAFMLTGFALTMHYENVLAHSLEPGGLHKPCFQVIAGLLLAILLWKSISQEGKPR